MKTALTKSNSAISVSTTVCSTVIKSIHSTTALIPFTEYDWFVEENGDSVYQNLSKLDGPRDFKRIWAFQSGTVVLKIDRDTEELLLVVNKPPVNNNEYPTELARQIYEPLSAYNGGVVTAAIFTCNATKPRNGIALLPVALTNCSH